MHQGQVIADVGAVRLVHKALVGEDGIHAQAHLQGALVQGRVHVVFTQAHAPETGVVQRPGG